MIENKDGPLPKVTDNKQVKEIGEVISREMGKMHGIQGYRPHRNLLHNIHRISWTVAHRDAGRLLSIFGAVGSPLGALRVNGAGDLHAKLP